MSVALFPDRPGEVTPPQPAGATPTSGLESATEALRARLRRHYCKPGLDRPGGVFVPEVGLNSSGPQRRCDAVWVGFTAGSGQLLIGHEIKVSRADWRHELDNLDKSETWASQCHAWYIVAPSTAIVPPEELPLGSGWGLMVPNSRSSNRMKIIVQATPRPDPHRPSWLIARSILARLDTPHAAEREQVREEERERARAKAAAERDYVDSISGTVASPEAERDKRILDRLEQTLCVDLRGRGDVPVPVRPESFALALKIAQHAGLNWAHPLTRTTGQLRVAADELEELAALVHLFTTTTSVDVGDRDGNGRRSDTGT